MVAAAIAAAALAHPCRAVLPRGPRVPAPLVLWNSCGGFQLRRDGTVTRLPRHWLARHSGGTGRRYGARLQLRSTPGGAIVLRERGRTVWRSTGRYRGGGVDVAFGPGSFAFATDRGGVYVTDLRGPERLVARGRGLSPFTFTASGRLIVVGGGSIRVISPDGPTVRLSYRVSNAFAFDEDADALFFVTARGRLARLDGTRITLLRSVRRIGGTLSVAPHLLVFTGERSLTIVRRDGTRVASASWRAPFGLDAGVAVAPDGRSFAYRLSNARPGRRSARATVYVLRAGESRARAVDRRRLGATGCAYGANLDWHGSSLLYGSSDGTLAVLDVSGVDLTRLARALPHRWAADQVHAVWRSAVDE